MKKYPVYDGTVHTFHLRKQDMKNYTELSINKKNYEARMTKEKYYDYSNIKVGDTAVFKRSGVSFEDAPIPAFEKKILKIESFNSLNDLRRKYPKIHITYPIKDISKWKKFFVKILGDFVYPKNKSYSVFWFIEKVA
jgi:hypothetical protein